MQMTSFLNTSAIHVYLNGSYFCVQVSVLLWLSYTLSSFKNITTSSAMSACLFTMAVFIFMSLQQLPYLSSVALVKPPASSRFLSSCFLPQQNPTFSSCMQILSCLHQFYIMTRQSIKALEKCAQIKTLRNFYLFECFSLLQPPATH